MPFFTRARAWTNAKAEKEEEQVVSAVERKDSNITDSTLEHPTQVDPFAGVTEEGDIEFRSLAWWQAGMVMIAETISLGILSLPSVLAKIGVVPGVLLIIGLGLAATYTGYVIGQFKVIYPHVHSMADAGEVLLAPLGMDRFGKEFFGAAQVIFLVFTMASHILTWTIMMNTITGSATCTIVWSVIGTVLLFIFDIPRTLKNMSWFSIACMCCSELHQS